MIFQDLIPGLNLINIRFAYINSHRPDQNCIFQEITLTLYGGMCWNCILKDRVCSCGGIAPWEES